MGDSNGIKLDLTLDEVNYILNALSEKPYKEVFPLIVKIQEQGNKQIKDDNDRNK